MVATGNSRYYQPLRRIERHHRRKSSNLLFSTFSSSPSSALPEYSPVRPRAYPYPRALLLTLSSGSTSFLSAARVVPIQRPDENGLGPFPSSKKEARKGGRRWPEAQKKADAPTTPTYLGCRALRSSRTPPARIHHTDSPLCSDELDIFTLTARFVLALVSCDSVYDTAHSLCTKY